MSDQTTKMPEPAEMWMQSRKKPDAQQRPCRVFTEFKLSPHPDWDTHGPHKIVPGMMSLDELWNCHKINIKVHRMDGWMVFNQGIRTTGVYDTALEAQWAATCLARTKQESKP